MQVREENDRGHDPGAHVTIPLWNNLPIDALSADTLPMFKYFVSPLFL